MKKRIIIVIILFLMSMNLSAQVVRTPQIFYTPVFSEKFEVMADSGCWITFRHMLNQQSYPDFGHDWESGVNINMFSSSSLAVSAMAEETFHFSAAPEPLSPWIFNAGSIISDLRLILYLNLDPLLVESGFRHDCKHEVERSSTRLQIHDLVFLIFRPKDNIKFITTEIFSLQANLAGEVEYNLPAVFQDAPYQPDLGHLACFFKLKGEFLTNPRIALLSDGSVSGTSRSEDSNVTGLENIGIDYNLRGGVAAIGKHGAAAFYIGIERLTDSWTDFDESPSNLSFISLELTSGIQ